jgi:hypothetical protein
MLYYDEEGCRWRLVRQRSVTEWPTAPRPRRGSTPAVVGPALVPVWFAFVAAAQPPSALDFASRRGSEHDGESGDTWRCLVARAVAYGSVDAVCAVGRPSQRRGALTTTREHASGTWTELRLRAAATVGLSRDAREAVPRRGRRRVWRFLQADARWSLAVRRSKPTRLLDPTTAAAITDELTVTGRDVEVTRREQAEVASRERPGTQQSTRRAVARQQMVVRTNRPSTSRGGPRDAGGRSMWLAAVRPDRREFRAAGRRLDSRFAGPAAAICLWRAAGEGPPRSLRPNS